MKLLFVHDHFLNKYNGKYYSTGSLSSDALKRYTNVFEEVKVITRQRNLKEKNEKLTLASTERVEFEKIPNFKSVKSLYKKIEAKKIIEMNIKKSDYLIARIPSSSGFIAIDYAKKYNVPYLIELVACPWDAFWNHSIKGKLIAPIMYFKTKKYVLESRNVIYVTNEFLQKRYPTRGENINCSNVVLNKFDNEIVNKRIEKICKKRENEPIILGTTAAVDVKFKGQQYIIKAISELNKQGYNYEYHLVGGGDNTYLKNVSIRYGVENKVKFVGPLPHDKVFEWLENIDIYVQPSRQEGLPRALIEAMSRGVPCIGAETGGIPELLENKFIFSNSKKNLSEICNILLSFNKEKMIEKSQRNYNESKKYDKKIIEERRREFFLEFKNM